MSSPEQLWEILQEIRDLRQLAAKQVELLQSILETQGRIERQILRGSQ